MTLKNFDDPITGNDTYYFLVPEPNKEYMVEVSDTFGGATVTLGYLGRNGVNVVYHDIDPMTVGAAWLAFVPSSGRLTLVVTGSSGTTSITVTAHVIE